jgi:hypothetical protein
MDKDKAFQELQVIRALMERPIRYTTLGGKSAVLAGLAALAGTAADWAVWFSTPPPDFTAALLASGAIWLGVLAVATAGTILLSWQREKRQGMPFWTSIKRRILATILPIFVASVGMTVGLVLHGLRHPESDPWVLIMPSWMLFYGVALWQLGLLSEPPVRVLAGAFFVAGLACCFVPAILHNPVPAMGATFGGFHLVYGLYVWRRYGG